MQGAKHGFQDVTLTLLILEPGSSFEMAVELEQYQSQLCCDRLQIFMGPFIVDKWIRKKNRGFM